MSVTSIMSTETFETESEWPDSELGRSIMSSVLVQPLIERLLRGRELHQCVGVVQYAQARLFGSQQPATGSRVRS